VLLFVGCQGWLLLLLLLLSWLGVQAFTTC
jgi:hypothetical protein